MRIFCFLFLLLQVSFICLSKEGGGSVCLLPPPLSLAACQCRM